MLIHNTIRLAVYSHRLLIKSMLLVGATHSFIRKPFIIKGLLQGLIGGALAVTGLAAVLFYAQQRVPEITVLNDIWFIVIIFTGVVVFGMLITWLSNYFAVKKYLKFKSDALY
jgi:cell division transport system permease protein